MEVVIRAVIVYFWSIILFRLLGKGLTFQQKPYDFTVMVLIASTSAALIVNRDVPLINALVALAVLALLHAALTVVTLNNTLKGFIGGYPDLLIRNGRIVKQNLIKNQVNLEQFMAALRIKGYRRIHDIEFAVLEANGQLSVIPKSQQRPVTPADLKLGTVYEGLATPLIIEGHVVTTNLKAVGLDRGWLQSELTKRNLEGPEKVLLALLDTDGSLYVAEQPRISPVKAFFMGEGKDKTQGET